MAVHEIDVSKIRMAVQAGVPLTITTYTLPQKMQEFMEQVLSEFLRELNQQHLTEYLKYCFNELIVNAKKANTKRVYFEEKGLDITSPADYELGMRTYKQDTLGNIDHYLQLQKEKGLYVKLVLQARNNKIKIDVRNNVELTIFEYKRIHDKVSRAQQYESMAQAMDEILDDSEGAGLGLIIMILMLQKIGCTDENYQFLCENGETITRMVIPLSGKAQDDLSVISREFVAAIDDLPQFQDNIIKINNLLSDPDSKMSDIARQISNDVTLSADLLKLVNSAAFALSSPCRSIGDAVKLVGIHGVRNLLLTIGSMNNLVSDDSKNKGLWSHSYKVAFYSHNLARNFCTAPADRYAQDDAYICGLLHDMGKLIFETAHPDSLSQIRAMCEERGIEPDVFERLFAGANHGEVGSMIARKWNFPDVIVDVIKYHHSPDIAPEQIRKLTSVVYTADLICHWQEHDIEYYQFDEDILALFNLNQEEKLRQLSERLQESFAGLASSG